MIQLGVELEAGKRMEEEMLFNNRRLEVELDECRHQLHLGGQKHEEEVGVMTVSVFSACSSRDACY